MRRIYVMLPDTQTARSIVDELLLKRIGWRHIHVLASDKVPLEDLPEASIAQSSDLRQALARGAAAGGITGALAGLAAIASPTAGLTIAGGAVVALTLAGAGFGAWMGSMIGVSVPSSRLERFKSAIERGEILMMVDMPRDRVEEIDNLIKGHHPHASVEGVDPTIPGFP
ncbi:hypothetical protein [Burkholderia thailandensis]|nr:hypothetical protein [Burkholderia thailandensis]AHI75104.1 putative transmembrane protein [Burkholderia thailandensis 2002721723]AHI81741.1 putative transmembrane protein [Burkholderia thailandensis E444]AIC90798.1 putative transmembrane protein [Burkholderia thailandensis USAMRU Malaysia \